MRLDSLKINPKNPRFIRDANFENLLKSIREFPEGLQVNKIVYDPGTMFVLAGNMRLKALQELGYNEIPDDWTLSASMLNEEQKKRFVIVDNIGFGEWDYQMLNEDWNTEELKDWGLEIPMFELKKNKVNSIDDEWLGMPEFEIKEKELSISIKFENEFDRNNFCEKFDLKIREKASRFTWSTWWPFKNQEDRNSLKYE